ncbi:MAG: AAA family ATPase [Gammaproteobacteria bacterium]|jgi:hypothetical protein
MPELISSLIPYLRTLHGATRIEPIETHISWVLLTGKVVYKIKKPVDLGFVDFTTLAKRRHFCFEELRLNKRLAPELYIDVVTLTEDDGNVVVNGDGKVVEYAVRLHQFNPQQQFDVLIEKHQLRFQHIDRLAAIIAEFHRNVESAGEDSDFGKPATIHAAVTENFRHCLKLANSADTQQLQALQTWSDKEFDNLRTFFTERRNQGNIRECHGDLHLGNIALFHDRVTPFDCIEFNPDFRWIDTISEIAFLVMDLSSRGRQDMATRFLNDYLTFSGDYLGVTGLRYYLVYRAMVRAKVEIIRAGQASNEPTQQQTALTHFHHYLELADAFRTTMRPALLITHGMSGAGKTTIVRELLKHLPAIHLRSDVERKRLFHLQPTDKSTSAVDRGIYTKQATEQTYDTLMDMTSSLIGDHWHVVVDATFLKQAQRNRFRKLAQQQSAHFLILDFTADADTLRQRVLSRSRQKDAISEASLEVLENQLESYQPLQDSEQPFRVDVDTRQQPDIQSLAQLIRSRCNEMSSGIY